MTCSTMSAMRIERIIVKIIIFIQSCLKMISENFKEYTYSADGFLKSAYAIYERSFDVIDR